MDHWLQFFCLQIYQLSIIIFLVSYCHVYNPSNYIQWWFFVLVNLKKIIIVFLYRVHCVIYQDKCATVLVLMIFGFYFKMNNKILTPYYWFVFDQWSWERKLVGSEPCSVTSQWAGFIHSSPHYKGSGMSLGVGVQLTHHNSNYFG